MPAIALEEQMLTDLLITGVLAPLAFGVLIGIVATARNAAVLTAILTFAAILAIYVLLEGVPPLPPIAVKQKIAFVYGAAGVLACILLFAPHGRRVGTILATLTFATGCLAWLAAPVLSAGSDPELLARGVGFTLFAAIAGAFFVRTFAAGGAHTHGDQLLALSVVLAFAIGLAIVALVGGFIGMGQMSAAVAALAGGLLLSGFFAQVRGWDRWTSDLLAPVHILVLVTLAISVAVAFFATSLNPIALFIVPLTFIAGPFVARGAAPLAHSPLRTVATGLIVAVPAAAAAALAIATRTL
jgi:hypothetical protein